MNYSIKSMKDFFQKKHPIIFIDKTSTLNLLSDQPIDIILSPSFYWIRKEELPVKSVFAAKKLIPSIFESILPVGNYSYHVLKKEGFFELFAYDDVQIISFLETLGIKSSQINAIYFAQNEVAFREQAIKITRQASMINNNGIWSMIPTQYAQNPVAIEDILSTIDRPKEKISIDIFKNFVLEEGQLYKIVASLIALIVVYGVDYGSLRQEFKLSSIIQYKIIDDYALPKTSLQLEGLKSELLKKENTQETMRKGIKKIIATPLLKEESFTELVIKKNLVSFAISLKDAKRAEELKKIISQEIQISSIKVIDLVMHVEVKL